MGRKDWSSSSTTPYNSDDFLTASFYSSDEEPAIIVIPTEARGLHARLRHLQSSETATFPSEIFTPPNTPTHHRHHRHHRSRHNLESDQLPPRVAMKQLYDRLVEARNFYSAQLTSFRKHHLDLKHTVSHGPMRQWLWRQWTGSLDSSKKDVFLSTETIILQHILDVERSFAAAPPTDTGDTLVKERFVHTMKQLNLACREINKLSGMAFGDWQACRFLLVELGTATKLADPEGKAHKHVFSGWGDDAI